MNKAENTPRQLHRLIFTVPESQDELLSGFLSTHTNHGWEESLSPEGELTAKVHLHEEEVALKLIDKFSLVFREGKHNYDKVMEEDWVEAWKEFFIPVKGGEHFIVIPPWMQEEYAKSERMPIIIEPKTAFGTGHHSSTALCLDMISLLFKNERIKEGHKFLDLGTGTGILGIACTKLGLRGMGLDIDPIAVDNALTNRELNAVLPESFALACGTQEEAEGKYDLIIANILAEPLRDMAQTLKDLLNKDGILILSGILVVQADSVDEAYQKIGCPPAQRLLHEEWAALCFDLGKEKAE